MTLGAPYGDVVEAHRCQALWASVLLLAFEDAQRDPHERHWFSPADRGFRAVCELAGLDPAAVAERARRSWMRRAEAPTA